MSKTVTGVEVAMGTGKVIVRKMKKKRGREVFFALLTNDQGSGVAAVKGCFTFEVHPYERDHVKELY